MNRKEEYLALRRELDEAPPALADTLTRARARLRARRRRFVALPAGGLAAAALLFVVLVNTSTSFAYACGQIPGLKSLAQFVALSPSLSAAVENAYVQPVEHEKTQDGITARGSMASRRSAATIRRSSAPIMQLKRSGARCLSRAGAITMERSSPLFLWVRTAAERRRFRFR